MPISATCPHCKARYPKLPDELAGKTVRCKKPECRQPFQVPALQTVPPSIAELGGIAPDSPGADGSAAPVKPPADAEAAALAALADAPAEQAASAVTVEVVCAYCDHHWTEPVAKAGKNVLCPNPECRQRVKVPDPPKGEAPQDWRTGMSNKPTLAKENFEQPKDVMNAEAKVVSKEAWEGGGGAEQDLEPIPLSRRLYFATLIGLPLLALMAGGVYLWQSWGIVREERVIQSALDEFATGNSELAPAQTPLYSALLHLAAAEFTLREQPRVDDKAKALKTTADLFGKARSELRTAGQKDDPRRPTTGERYAIASELAVAQLTLGGTPEQIADGTRYRWLPEPPSNRPLRVNERIRTLHEELQHTLPLMQGADFDTKAVLLRRLTRELAKYQQDELALGVVVMLFPESEQAEARAITALELYRQDRNSEKVQQIANELKQLLSSSGNRWNPVPASAQTLWLLLGTEKVPTVAPPPPPAPAQVLDTSRLAYIGLHLLQGNPDEAFKLAGRSGGSLLGRLRGYALCAEWGADSFDGALATLQLHTKGKKDASPPPASVVLRLAQRAAAAGKPEQAKQLAEAIPDEGLRLWAKGDAVHQTATAENKNRIEETAIELPEDPKMLRAGHAWGRFWIARQNARATGDKGKLTKEMAGWPKGTIHPFGLAGLALGLQDR